MYITNNNTRYSCSARRYNGKDVVFDCEGLPENISGEIELCSDDGFSLAVYNTNDFLRTVISSNTLTLTDALEPVPHTPTLDELRTEALTRIDGKCSATIFSGFDLNGKHYTATMLDQSNIKDALLAFELGKTVYPYAAVGEERTPHTKEQIAEIANGMSAWGLVCTGYYAQLKIWIARETDGNILSTIDFGTALPDDLMQALATELSQYGINLTDYAEMLS